MTLSPWVTAKTLDALNCTSLIFVIIQVMNAVKRAEVVRYYDICKLS